MVCGTAAALGASAGARAGDLKNIISDLYGGDGITLAPPMMGFSHAPHFTASSLMRLDELNTALASGVGFFSFNSPVTGFTFDVETGDPMRISGSLGPLLGERATTLGKNKLDLGFTYTHIDYRRLEGTRLNDLNLTFVHDDVNGDGILGPLGDPMFEFELDVINADVDVTLKQDIYAIFANYGLTSNWDVGIIVPIVHTEARATAVATIIDNSPLFDIHSFDPTVDPPISRTGGTQTGIGDVVLRTKYNFLLDDDVWPDMAVGGQVIFPTGDEDNLLGTGETFLKAVLITSKSFDWFTPHANFAFEIAPDNSELNNLRYVAGFEAAVVPSLTAAVDVLGRWEPSGDGVGDNLVDLALGARWNFTGNSVLIGNILLPLNRDEGLRADVIWTIGIEHTF